MSETRTILEEIAGERKRQKALALDGSTDDFDASNTRNDWVSFVAAYIGRAADKCKRNEREACEFRENMLKAAALCVAAIEAHDKGTC